MTFSPILFRQKTYYLLVPPSQNGGRTFHLHVTFLCQKSVTPGIFSSFWKSISNAPFPGDLSCFMQWHWHHAGLCWALSACCYCYVPLVIFLCIISFWIFLMKNIIGVYSLHRVMGLIKTFSFNSMVCFKHIPLELPLLISLPSSLLPSFSFPKLSSASS